MFSKRLLIAATALSLTVSQAMAAGEQLQLTQSAEQLKTALAGESVVLTPQILDLSARRAMSVVRYLVAHGVDANVLSAQAFGAMNPVAPNDSPDGQAKNRRVEIMLIGDGS